VTDQLLITNARIVLPDRVEQGAVLIRDGRIAQVFSQDPPTGLGASETLDAAGAYLAPGMIDIHIHGSAGVDVMDADTEALSKLSDFLFQEGVTGYFPTLVPTDTEGYLSALSAISSFAEQQASPGARPSARILGVHFEGPFVSKNRCGALHPDRFRTYDGDLASLDLFTLGAQASSLLPVPPPGAPLGAQPSSLLPVPPLGAQTRLAAASCLLPAPRLITLAPEIDGGISLIRDLVSRGLRVFIGHTQADPATLDQAAAAGARHITHFPNALDPLHHRKPGAVAWGLVRDDVTMDCIADFHHIDPLMLRLMYQAKGGERLALISDAIPPTGLGDGVFSVWGDNIAVRDGLTSLVRSDEGTPATIAGSVITMRQAVKNMISLGVPVHEAIRMASLAPARVSGMESECGSIEVGKRADLIVLDDDLRISRTVPPERVE
jgi:N-acetylglucosamine-6-phosphate deacetylase